MLAVCTVHCVVFVRLLQYRALCNVEHAIVAGEINAAPDIAFGGLTGFQGLWKRFLSAFCAVDKLFPSTRLNLIFNKHNQIHNNTIEHLSNIN